MDISLLYNNFARRIANAIDGPKSLSRISKLNNILIGNRTDVRNGLGNWVGSNRDGINFPYSLAAGTGIGGVGGFLNYKRKRKNFDDKLNSILNDNSLSPSAKFNKLNNIKAPSLLLNTAAGAGLGLFLGGAIPVTSDFVERNLAINKLLRANNVKLTSNVDTDFPEFHKLYHRKNWLTRHNDKSLLRRIDDWFAYGTPILKQKDNIKWFNPYDIK